MTTVGSGGGMHTTQAQFPLTDHWIDHPLNQTGLQRRIFAVLHSAHIFKLEFLFKKNFLWSIWVGYPELQSTQVRQDKWLIKKMMISFSETALREMRVENTNLQEVKIRRDVRRSHYSLRSGHLSKRRQTKNVWNTCSGVNA